MTSDVIPERLVLTSRQRRGWLGLTVLATVIGLAVALLNSDHAAALAWALVAGVLAVLVRRTRTTVDREGITDNIGPLTRRIVWAEIEAFDVAMLPGVWPGRTVVVTRRDGRPWPLFSLTIDVLSPSSAKAHADLAEQCAILSRAADGQPSP